MPAPPASTAVARGGRIGGNCEFGKMPGHRSIHLAPERHYEIGDVVEPFPSPALEFRRLTVALRQRIDFIIASAETQREPFLALAPEFRKPVRRRGQRQKW